MIEIKTVQHGIDDAIRKLKTLKSSKGVDALGGVAAVAMAGRAGASVLARVEKDVAPVYRGSLQGSIGIIEEKITPVSYHAEVGTRGIYYALLQNDGGTITPTNAKSLRIVNTATNTVTFAKMVRMPAQRYMEEALERAGSEVRAAVMRSLGV